MRTKLMEHLKHKGFPTCSIDQVTSLVETLFDNEKTENYWLSFRNNLNNSWNVNSNGNFNNNNTNNLNVIIPVIDLCDKLLESEKICWKNKHSSLEAVEYHFHLALIIELANQLYNNTYYPSTTKCFVIAYPVWREIFAALYKDRIIHHLVAPFISEVCEMIHTRNGNISHGNRKGHSALYGAERIKEDIKELTNNYTEDCYVSTNDFSGFFMSINRLLAYDLFYKYLLEFKSDKYTPEYREFLLKTCKILILHDPTKDYVKISPLDSWDKVPDRKSMFHSNKGCGLPIGNFYSLLIANLYLGEIDSYLHNLKDIRVERFVDDVFIGAKKPSTLVDTRNNLIKLATSFNLKISPNKFYIQPYYNGIKFCGRIIKRNRIYLINRTIRACSRRVSEFSLDNKKLRATVNSYFGLFSKCLEYNNQKKIMFRCLSFKHKAYFKREHNQLIYKIKDKSLIYKLMKLGKYINEVMSTVETEDIEKYKEQGYKPIVETIQPSEESILKYEDEGEYYLEVWEYYNIDNINYELI